MLAVEHLGLCKPRRYAEILLTLYVGFLSEMLTDLDRLDLNILIS